MDDTTIYEKTLIYIDSNNCVYNGNVCDFYVDIVEPLKNVAFIKIMKSVAIIKPKQQLGGQVIQDHDPIYIKMNDYNRITSVVNGNPNKYFDMITINLTDVYSMINEVLLAVTEVAFTSKNSHTDFDINDSSIFTVSPPQDSLKRFSIQLYDKNNKIITKSEVLTFKMTLCVYTIKKSQSLMAKNI